MLTELMTVSNWALGLGAGLAGLGAGVVTVGAAMGLSKIASTTVESIARQPEAAGAMFTPMIIVSAMLEGVALFAAAVCFMAQNGWLATFQAVTKTGG